MALVRRALATGRFRAASPLDRVPLFAVAFARPRKSPPHLLAWTTRRAKRSAWVAAHCAQIIATFEQVEF